MLHICCWHVDIHLSLTIDQLGEVSKIKININPSLENISEILYNLRKRPNIIGTQRCSNWSHIVTVIDMIEISSIKDVRNIWIKTPLMQGFCTSIQSVLEVFLCKIKCWVVMHLKVYIFEIYQRLFWIIWKCFILIMCL